MTVHSILPGRIYPHIKLWYTIYNMTIYGVTLKHGPVGVVGNSENVRGDLVTLLALVHVHNSLSVDRKSFVRIYNHAE